MYEEKNSPACYGLAQPSMALGIENATQKCLPGALQTRKGCRFYMKIPKHFAIKAYLPSLYFIRQTLTFPPLRAKRAFLG
jgi:hypothetical protein